jgi:dethiobiotin synthetase
MVFPRTSLNAQMAFTVFTTVLHGLGSTNHVEIYNINLNTRQLPLPIWVFTKEKVQNAENVLKTLMKFTLQLILKLSLD